MNNMNLILSTAQLTWSAGNICPCYYVKHCSQNEIHSDGPWLMQSNYKNMAVVIVTDDIYR